MDLFVILLAVATAVRGFGAGIIYDVARISLPLRKQIGVIPYAQYARANFNKGFKTYGPVSIIGLLLTIAVTVFVFIHDFQPVIFWSVVSAMLSTILAFAGTSRALPAVMNIRKLSHDEAELTKIFDNFAFWHSFSTLWQVISFLSLVVALAFA